MKAVFTVGSTANTLADYTASPALYGVIEHWPLTAVVQKEPLYGAPNPAIFARGNVSGQFVFTVRASYASYNACTAAIKAAQALVGLVGSLVVTPVTSGSPTTYTMSNAILSAVAVKQTGLQATIKYTFEITTIT